MNLREVQHGIAERRDYVAQLRGSVRDKKRQLSKFQKGMLGQVYWGEKVLP